MMLDPDEWRSLAQTDPQEFERRRLQAIDAVIEAAPESQRARLRGLQFRIDLERRRAVTTLGACIKLNTMMWDSFVALRESLAQLTNEGALRVAGKPGGLTKVIPFATGKPSAE
jgi:Protein of unknown function (DUF3135)